MTMMRQFQGSPCGRFRYSLTVQLRSFGPRVAVVTLHAGLGDAWRQDIEAARILDRARAAGWGTVEIVALFARRCRNGGALRSSPEIVGRDNLAALSAAMARADLVIGAWGCLATEGKRVRDGWRLAVEAAELANRPIRCWATEADGQPVDISVQSRQGLTHHWSPPHDD